MYSSKLVLLLGGMGECTHGAAPLGMESGTIPDSSLTASSMVDVNHGPKRARLNMVKVGGLRGGWVTRDSNPWIQVKLTCTSGGSRISEEWGGGQI